MQGAPWCMLHPGLKVGPRSVHMLQYKVTNCVTACKAAMSHAKRYQKVNEPGSRIMFVDTTPAVKIKQMVYLINFCTGYSVILYSVPPRRIENDITIILAIS